MGAASKRSGPPVDRVTVIPERFGRDADRGAGGSGFVPPARDEARSNGRLQKERDWIRACRFGCSATGCREPR